MEMSVHSVEQKIVNSGQAGNINQTVNVVPAKIMLVPPPRDLAWVERPPYQEVKSALLQKRDGQRSSIVSAMHAMGGTGKTWLARAIANDLEICKAMSVLWVNVGQNMESSEAIMGDLISLLAPSHPRTITSDGMQIALRGLLSEKAYLLVLDDVWTEEIAEHFVALFPNISPSRLLITTRKKWIADKLLANSFPLGLMTEAESLALFEKHLDRSLQPSELISARQLAKIVDYLPLALRLVIARIKKGQDWDDIWDRLNQNLHALHQSTTPRPGEKIEPSLEAVFNTSLNPLRDAPKWRASWEGFIRLSVLAEDTQITTRIACHLLGGQGKEILELLADESLLIPIHSDGRTYQIHDLLQVHGRYLLALPSPQGLGETLQQAEMKILACYGLHCDRPETFQVAWKLEDDGYIQTRLVYHLARLNQLECIEAVLNAETPDGKNGWFQTRESLGQTSGFVADVEQWQTLLCSHIRTQVNENILPDSLGKVGRCILLLATMRSLAENISVELLQNLVRFGVWKPEQALAYLRQAGNQYRKAAAIKSIMPYLPTFLLQHAMEFVLNIENDDRMEALIALAPQMSPERRTQILPQILEFAQNIEDQHKRAQTLIDLVPYLSPEQTTQALETVQKIKDRQVMVQTLLKLAPHLPSTLLQQAFIVIRNIYDQRLRAEALAGLAPHLPQDQRTQVLKQALETAQNIKDERTQVLALTKIVPFVPQDQRTQVLKQALETMQNIPNYNFRADVLISLAPHLPQDQRTQVLKQALETAQNIKDERTQVLALTKIVPFVPQDQRTQVLKQALETMQNIPNYNFRADVLISLAPHLPQDQRTQVLKQALKIAQDIEDDEVRAQALIGLAPHLPQDQRTQVLKQALKIAQDIEDDEVRAQALIGLAPHLPQDQRTQVLKQALKIAQDIEDDEVRAQTLIGLVPYLPQDQRTQVLPYALKIAQVIEDRQVRAQAFIGLVPYLPQNQRTQVLKQVLKIAQNIKDQRKRAQALIGLVPHLPLPLLQQVIKIVQNIVHHHIRLWMLIGLAPYLTSSLLQQALEIAQDIEDDEVRAQALIGLAPYLTSSLLQQALEIAQVIEDRQVQAQALIGLVPYLPQDQRTQVLKQVLKIAQNIKDRLVRAEVLISLVPHLSQDQRTQVLPYALKIAQDTEDDEVRAQAFIGLAPYLTSSLLQQALEIAQDIEDDEVRAQAFIGLAPYLTSSLLQQALEIAQDIEDDEVRAQALIGLAPYLTSSLLQQALEIAQDIKDDEVRAQALIGLAPHLPQDQRTQVLKQALKIAQAIVNEQVRSKVIFSLAIGVSGHQSSLCSDILVAAGLERREVAMGIITRLSRGISEIGKAEAACEIFRAINDVAKWWA